MPVLTPVPGATNIVTGTVGYLRRETVHLVVIPREVWVEAVEEMLRFWSDELSEATSAKLLETARTMDRFPFGNWVHSERGCGCLIGEYLVAQDAFETYNDLNLSLDAGADVHTKRGRRQLWANIQDNETITIESILGRMYEADEAEALYRIGIKADQVARELSHEYASHGDEAVHINGLTFA